MKKRDESVILFISSYPPRECGIATFTKDLASGINKKFNPRIKSEILSLNKSGSNIYRYPREVKMQINDNEVGDYIEAAKKINRSDRIKLVCIQHEFGLFGGEYGDNLLAFLELLEKPVVVNFHSILPNPDDRLKRVVRSIAEKVNCILVMTKKGEEILRKEYHIYSLIKVIPHGIPNVTFENQKREKRNLGFENKLIISSFGFLSRGKGYEFVLDAMPEIIKKYPNLIYLIVGETHPVVRKNEGEEYRNFLEKKVRDLGLQNNVRFHDKYLSLREIISYLKSTDIYISSGLNPNQITSGPLVYALGSGRSVVSTPFLHAKDCIKENIGRLVKYNNPESYKDAICEILENPKKKILMERDAYNNTRHMTWENVSLAYGRIFNKILNTKGFPNLPRIDTSHMFRLSDNFGIIQFANQHYPDIKSGYTLDDNARALLVSVMHYSIFKEYKTLQFTKIYLDYLKYVQDKDGKMYNFVDYDKKINFEKWSEDAQGRGVWALGVTLGNEHIPNDLKNEARKILNKSIKVIMNLQSPRSIAFSLIGLCHATGNKEDYYEEIIKLADWLVSAYETNSHDNWFWYENYLTYSNSKIPEALFLSYRITKDKRYFDVAEKSLKFLMNQTFKKSVFVPIGQDGWFVKGGKRSYFDQQPVEAAYMVQTLSVAYGITLNEFYKKRSFDTFQWFLGKNLLNQVVYNEITAGCHDGLGKETINLNQGAESTLGFLMARLCLPN